MAKEKKGMMFILSSPSGAGKTTLTKKLQKIIKISRFRFLILQENQDPMKLTEKIISLLVCKNLIP